MSVTTQVDYYLQILTQALRNIHTTTTTTTTTSQALSSQNLTDTFSAEEGGENSQSPIFSSSPSLSKIMANGHRIESHRGVIKQRMHQGWKAILPIVPHLGLNILNCRVPSYPIWLRLCICRKPGLVPSHLRAPACKPCQYLTEGGVATSMRRICRKEKSDPRCSVVIKSLVGM